MDEITKDNLIANLQCIINGEDIISLYNEVVMKGSCSRERLRDIVSAYFYIMLIKYPNSNSIAKLASLLMRIEDTKTSITKAQYLFFIYLLSQIDIDKDSKEDLNLYM